MTPNAHEVAIVTGGSSETGREVAGGLAGWGWSIVLVYLEDQRAAEATVCGILAVGGDVVAVRADLADDLDVQRLYAESSAAFGEAGVVVHTMPESVPLLYRHAARHLRSGGVIVDAATEDPVALGVARHLRDRGITVGRAPPDGVLAFLDTWRRH